MFCSNNFDRNLFTERKLPEKELKIQKGKGNVGSHKKTFPKSFYLFQIHTSSIGKSYNQKTNDLN